MGLPGELTQTGSGWSELLVFANESVLGPDGKTVSFSRAQVAPASRLGSNTGRSKLASCVSQTFSIQKLDRFESEGSSEKIPNWKKKSPT